MIKGTSIDMHDLEFDITLGIEMTRTTGQLKIDVVIQNIKM